MEKTIVKTNANIALIKYWGKRDEKLFLPTKSSLSVCLDTLSTVSTICINNLEQQDEIFINNKKIKNKEKIVIFLNLFRKKYNVKNYFKINSINSFPTNAGLASSSSGFAAIAFGLNKLCNLNLSKKELSILARQGSGSASRSIYGGFVLWSKGVSEDGSDSFSQQLFSQNYWPEFSVLVIVVDEAEKKISSRNGMQITVNTSPFYKSWIEESEKKIEKMIEAIKQKDFLKVGKLAEDDCLDMHKCMQSSRPPINYWQPATRRIMRKVKKLRNEKIDCFFTIDAGPNVKILCLNKDINKIKKTFEKIDGVQKIIVCKIGGGAENIGL